jgi:translation initiation factor 2 subunit 2
VDENGAVTMMEEGHDDAKGTAQSHSSTPPLSQASTASTNPTQGIDATADEPTKEGDDVAEMLKGMKKKKSKKPKADDGEAEGGEGEGEGDAAADGGLDLSTMKKKKKKAPKEGAKDDFAAKIAALDINEKDGEAAAVEKPVDEGDMEKGTGIWQHDETKSISYELLLSRFFNLLAQKNPDHASSGSRSYKIPPPQCLREGNKKTIFANIAEICKRMKRTDEHVTSYLFAELGTSGSVDGRQIENVLRRYISKFLKFLITQSSDY